MPVLDEALLSCAVLWPFWAPAGTVAELVVDAPPLRSAVTALLSAFCVRGKFAGLSLLVTMDRASTLLLPAASLVLSSWGTVADDAELALFDTVGGETFAEVPDLTGGNASTEGVRLSENGACRVTNMQVQSHGS